MNSENAHSSSTHSTVVKTKEAEQEVPGTELCWKKNNMEKYTDVVCES